MSVCLPCWVGKMIIIISRRVARILHWGEGGTEVARVHFLSKKLATFFSRRSQNLSSPSSGDHIFAIFEAHRNTSGRENSVTLY